jgi:hypothetical protein
MGRDSQFEEKTDRLNWGAAMLPYLMACWCCLVILQDNPIDIPALLVVAKTVAIVLLAVAVAHAVLLVAIRKSTARELILFQLVAFVGLYGACKNILFPIMGSWMFVAFCVALNIGAATMFWRFVDHKFIKVLVSVCLFGISITLGFQLIGVGMPVVNDARQVGNLLHELSADDPLPEQAVDPKRESPDIYYIIVDAYGREDILQELYGFDNRSFTNALRERGFYIGDESRSNYHFTELSLASSLNMTHLHELELQRFQTRMPVRNMIKDSTVVRFLKRQGYETVAFETGKSDTQCGQFDRYISFGNALNDYQDTLYYKSLIPRLLDWTGNSLLSAAHRHGARTLATLESIPLAVSSDSKPTFIFSHLLAPHPPFVFDAQGQAIDLHGHYLLADGSLFTCCYDYDVEVYRKAYRDQVAFINQKLITMVERIQANDRRSIIIIQADHGPRLGFGSRESIYPKEAAARYQEGFSILNAICLPDDGDAAFYSSMTPVNTFRLIFNEVFGTNLELEADESYFEHDYAFQNVTRQALPADQTDLDSAYPETDSPNSVTPVSISQEH